MYLAQLKLWNFRKYATKDGGEISEANPGLEVNFKPGVNLLIGENDSGKTAIIDAIKHLLLTQSREYIALEPYDFHKDPGKSEEFRTRKLKIEAVFKNFKPEEAANFLEWIGFNDKGEYELKVWLTAENKDNRVIVNFKAGADSEGSPMDGEARDLLRVTYLKPLRDAEAELTPGYKSRLAQILKNYPAFNKDLQEYENHTVEHHGTKVHKLEKYIIEANKLIEEYFKPSENENNANAGKIKTDIKEYLNAFFPEGEFDEDSTRDTRIEISKSDLNNILQKLSLSLAEDKSGLGALNLLFIATELLLLQYSRADSLKLLLVEEIEAHLHAQAQLRLIEYFRTKENEEQLILTTHSITLGSKIPLENLFICKNDKVFPMGHNDTQLNQGDYKFLERFLDATKANLFFARGVIIVEGDAENILIPTIAEIIGTPLHGYGVSIVNVGSTAYKRYAKIFLRQDKDDEKYKNEWLDIPVSIISDKDKNKEDKIKDIEKRWNKQNLQIFISKHKTLEYVIALGKFQKEIFHAILIAQKIKNSTDENFYQEIFNDENEFVIPKEITEEQKKCFVNWTKDIDEGDKNSRIAFEIYKHLKEKQVSKAITAQIFSEIISIDKEESKKRILADEYLAYIVDAINHVSNTNITE
ncbi:ATP-dependent nuclease [Anaerophaga thermohalophila]|jgi:putative ATP-dependent endonuclease of OLD family|uniref:ATP-dependent nuclease n=1 Tax=Anaerophaga thermohalophila TaxID=177400 RepID=UPI00030ED665|nr:AAA family ATPase [Anaerophaga thermohalophila]